MKAKKRSAVLLVLVLLLLCAGCGNNSSENNSILGESVTEEDVFVINISVNPQAELYVDVNTDKVVRVACLNSDAEKLIIDGNLDLLNEPYDIAAETIINACIDEGYLTADNNDVRIEVVRGEVPEEKADEYNEKMESVYNNVTEETDFEMSVYMECMVCRGLGVCTQCLGEGKYVCSVCGGTAGSPCAECEGDGLIPCPYCDGFGGCKDCNKTGVAVCDKCGGAGSGCDWCHGSGTMECKTCHGHPLCEGCEDKAGSGYHHCNACAGTGKTSCWRCDSTGYEPCSRCNGDGLCPSCHGEKEAEN